MIMFHSDEPIDKMDIPDMITKEVIRRYFDTNPTWLKVVDLMKRNEIKGEWNGKFGMKSNIQHRYKKDGPEAKWWVIGGHVDVPIWQWHDFDLRINPEM